MNSDQVIEITTLSTLLNNVSFLNESDNAEYIPMYLRVETYLVPVLFLVIFVVGTLGNGTLIYIFIRHKDLRNVPNTFIMSLSLGDLLVIIVSVPFTSTVYTIDSWPYGEFICKFSEFVKDISIGVSVFTLTALSMDRYIAIVDPLKKHMGGRAGTLTVITAIAIWIVSIALAMPAVLFSHVKTFGNNETYEIYVCYPFPEYMGEYYPRINVLIKFLIYYAVPLIIISIFYTIMAYHLLLSSKNMPGEAQGQKRQIEARKKVAKMVLSFVVIFAICFFPNYLFLLWFYFNPSAEDEYNFFWHYVRIIGFCLSFINSCINPIALYCVSGVFRNYYNKYLFCCCVRGKKMRKSRLTRDADGQTTMVFFNSTIRRTSTTTTVYPQQSPYL